MVVKQKSYRSPKMFFPEESAQRQNIRFFISKRGMGQPIAYVQQGWVKPKRMESVQGGWVGQKRPKSCVRTMYAAPYQDDGWTTSKTPERPI